MVGDIAEATSAFEQLIAEDPWVEIAPGVWSRRDVEPPQVTPPAIGEQFRTRTEIKQRWGGDFQQGMATFPLDVARVVNIFSDDNGAYPDREVPGTDRIEYVGQGRSGDQKLTSRGNALLEEAREAGDACRYWHKPVDGLWTFERWVAVVGRHRIWQKDQGGAWRRAYVFDLAPVSSPSSRRWPAATQDESATGGVFDDLPELPPDPSASNAASLADLYRRRVAETSADVPSAATRRTAIAYARSDRAREAVLIRAGDACENPRCTGMPPDRLKSGDPILEVDHVRDLALGGPDSPENMIALCPNCHAAKTRGKGRERLRSRLAKVATARHAQLLAAP